MVTVRTFRHDYNSFAFFPYGGFMCWVFVSEYATISPINNINQEDKPAKYCLESFVFHYAVQKYRD